MDKQIELKIITPEKVLYQEMVDSVSFQTMDGEITVLPNHLPIISAIKPGELRIKKEKEVEYFSVTRGVAEVDGKSIIILTDAAEKAEEIDMQRAEQARERAKELMSQKAVDEEGYADAVAHLERAISRAKIAKRRRSGRGSNMPNINQ